MAVTVGAGVATAVAAATATNMKNLNVPVHQTEDRDVSFTPGFQKPFLTVTMPVKRRAWLAWFSTPDLVPSVKLVHYPSCFARRIKVV